MEATYGSDLIQGKGENGISRHTYTSFRNLSDKSALEIGLCPSIFKPSYLHFPVCIYYGKEVPLQKYIDFAIGSRFATQQDSKGIVLRKGRSKYF